MIAPILFVCLATSSEALLICQAAEAPTTVAHWRFEERPPGDVASGLGSLRDSSGNGLHATPYGDPMYSTTQAPFGNSSLEFDGRRQWAAIPDHPLFELTESLTIEAYVELSQFPTRKPPGVVLWRGDRRIFLDPYSLEVEAQGQVTFYVQDERGNISKLTSGPVLEIGEMTHIAGTFDHTTGTQSVYVQGVLVATKITSIRPFGKLTGSEPGVGIGSLAQNADFLFPGKIDEVRLSRAALQPKDFLVPFTADAHEVSMTTGGEVRMSLRASSEFGHSAYLVLGSYSGTSPGMPIGRRVLPLNQDRYFNHTLRNPSESLFDRPIGLLNRFGEAEVTLRVPPGRTWLAGLTVHHAFVLLGRDFVSNATLLELTL